MWARIDREDEDPVRTLLALRAAGEEVGLAACSTILRDLTHLWIPEHEAETLLLEILGHRAEISSKLGRDPGFAVTALDYLLTKKNLLREPVFMERSDFDRLQRSARTDPLTGLPNRRVFRKELSRELSRGRRYRLKTSLILFDLDRFKDVNDRHGHMLGDLVLQEVAGRLKDCLRGSDRICRFGGEEFAVMLPETTRLAAYRLAERMREAVHKGIASEALGGTVFDLTISGGIATSPEDGREMQVLFEHADAALYRAKRLGRDQTCLHVRERRRSVRYPVRTPAQIHFIREGGAAGDVGRGLDLSMHGALLVASANVCNEEPVALTFPRRSPAAPEIEVCGRVVRVDTMSPGKALHRIAVRFDREMPAGQLLARVHCGSARPVGGGV
jgi:diguanylate cyclase (GGDEF)-like protein